MICTVKHMFTLDIYIVTNTTVKWLRLLCTFIQDICNAASVI